MPDLNLNLYRVHENGESHVVIAHDEAQARGIAFGYRFSDPDEWDIPRMMVQPIGPRVAARMAVEGEPHEPGEPVNMPRTLALCLQQATGPEYVGGSIE